MRDLIFVSMEDWNEVWRRNQFLCHGLAKRFPTLKILFVGLPVDVSHNLRRGKIPKSPLPWPVPDSPNIIVMHPLKLAPNSLGAGRRLNETLMRSHIRRIAQKMKVRNPILWLNPHSAVHMAGKMGESTLIYDITDDWALASFPIHEKHLIEAQDQALCRQADLVVVCSEALAKSRRERCKRLLLLPNGVDANHYKDVASLTSKKELSWPAPVFGYTGTLHSDRIDIALIIALARAFPQGSIVLIGPNHLDAKSQAQLRLEKNIYSPGVVPYKHIPESMAQFDVCIVPHIESDFTESLNPIKLWEYLACGKPIVSTNVAGFRSFMHLCHIASGPEAFITSCHDALNENGVGRRERMEEAAHHSWESRLDHLLVALHEIGAA